jgi:cobalt-zinc-cadmium efflux system outer membrane protein
MGERYVKTDTTAAILVGVLIQAAPLVSPIGGAAQVAEGRALADETQIRRVTLDEALGLIGSNFQLRMTRSTAAEAEALARQSRAYPNPAFSASHEALDESGLGISESYFTLSQRLEWPGARSARQEAASESATSARIRVAADSAALAFEVKRAYVEAARAERHAETLSRVTAIFRQAVESAGERYEEGDLSLYDRRRIEVERVRYESSLADAVLDLSLARRELALLVAPQADDLQLAPADPSVGMPPAMNLDRLQTLAVSRRPEVAAQEADMRSARAELSQARAQRVPDVTANGGLKRQSDGFSGLFLGMSVPIPMWNRSAGAIEAADARVSREETRLALARREIEEEARSTLEAYRSQMRRAEFLSEAGESSSFDLLDIAEVAYGAGEMELLGLLDAAEALRDAEMAEVRIQSDLWISYYDLERAVGGF